VGIRNEATHVSLLEHSCSTLIVATCNIWLSSITAKVVILSVTTRVGAGIESQMVLWVITTKCPIVHCSVHVLSTLISSWFPKKKYHSAPFGNLFFSLY